MDDDGQNSPSGERRGVLDFWPNGEVWFREHIPDHLPWGDDSLLEEAPASARGHYGVKAGESVQVDGERYRPGEVVVVDSEAELRRLAQGMGRVEGIILPWYDRIVPPGLWMPHRERIDLETYRREHGARIAKSFLIAAGLVALVFLLPKQFMVLALLGAAFYGLFPLVEASMAWLRRVDRYSVDDLNTRLVGRELFGRWIGDRPAGALKAALVVLVLVFVGQMVVGPFESIERAALVKSAVLQDGEWWRTVTTGLMHGSVLHILFNGLALYTLGRVIVALVSPALLSIVFTVTVVTGSLASLWFGPGQASVGASGGILGCLGFLLVVTEKFKRELPDNLRSSLLQSTIVVAIFGLLGSQFIDNAAHGGGFLGGIAMGILFYPRLQLAPERTGFAVKLLSWSCLAVLGAGVVKIGLELWSAAG